jgi:hypothetical protein
VEIRSIILLPLSLLHALCYMRKPCIRRKGGLQRCFPGTDYLFRYLFTTVRITRKEDFYERL